MSSTPAAPPRRRRRRGPGRRRLAVAAHYGDPLREQRRLAEGAGLVDRSDRDVLAVPGADRLTWLHSLTSQHLDRLGDATGTEALVLSPQGHVEHHVVLAELGRHDVGRRRARHGCRAARLPRADALHAPGRARSWSPTRWAVLSLVGPRALRRPRPPPACPPPPRSTRSRRCPAAGSCAACRAIGDGTAAVVDLLVPRGLRRRGRRRLLAAGAGSPGVDAYEALRVEARRPRARRRDTDHRTIPNELEWLTSAVHLDKGCYRGQETVARVHNLGRPPRRLVLLHLDGVSEDLTEPGAAGAGRRPRGRPGGTVVRHHELGVIALALVKQSVAQDAALTVGGSVAAIDPDDAVAEVDDTRAAARDRIRAVRSATMPRA